MFYVDIVEWNFLFAYRLIYKSTQTNINLTSCHNPYFDINPNLLQES